MTGGARRYRIFIVAGEESGDILGARLMEALTKKTGGAVSFSGVGGTRMKAAGLTALFPMEDLSVMGLTEVVARLPLIWRRLKETTEAAVAAAPDAVVTIDSPDFCLRIVRRLRRKGLQTRFIHYVAPSVWAWRPGRAKKLARLVDRVLALLPFEPPYFEKEGLPCTFVGHPAAEMTTVCPDKTSERQGRELLLLPGSRVGEITRLLPVFAETVRILGVDVPGLKVTLPTLPHLEELVARIMGEQGLTARIVADSDGKQAAFARADAALAASGTVALELAAAGTPFVIGYRLSALSSFIARRLVKTPYVSLVNIVLGSAVVPERLLENCRPEILAGDLRALLTDPAAAQAQRDAFKKALALLYPGQPPAEKAAEAVLAEIASA